MAPANLVTPRASSPSSGPPGCLRKPKPTPTGHPSRRFSSRSSRTTPAAKSKGRIRCPVFWAWKWAFGRPSGNSLEVISFQVGYPEVWKLSSEILGQSNYLIGQIALWWSKRFPSLGSVGFLPGRLPNDLKERKQRRGRRCYRER